MSGMLERRMEDLYERLRLLRDEREKLLKEAEAWADRRDGLHEEIRGLRLRAEELRSRRDELNEEVKRLKTLRQASLERRKGIIEEIRELNRERAKADAGKPRRSRSRLEAEIERIEWRIQTEPLPLDMERKLINQVRTLEAQLELYRRAEGIRRRIADLRREAESLRAEAADYRSRIQEAAGRSQEYHTKMMMVIETIMDLQAKADEMHKRYVEFRGKAREVSSEIKRTMDEIRSVRALIEAEEERERKRKEADLERQTEERALEKLRRGERLTFDEFKLLIEKGRI
jgi:phosphoserine phosphatase